MMIIGIWFHYETSNGPHRSFVNVADKFTNQDAPSGIVLCLKSQQGKPVAKVGLQLMVFVGWYLLLAMKSKNAKVVACQSLGQLEAFFTE